MKKDFNRIGATLCSSMRPRSSTTSWLNKFKLLALVLTTMLSVNVWGVTDEFTVATSGVTSTSYTAFSNKSLSSSAKYAGKVARNDYSKKYALQLNGTVSNNIVTTASGGVVTNITVTWATNGTNNTNGRYLTIYGQDDAYSATQSATAGTSCGTITYTTGATTTSLDLSTSKPKNIMIVASAAIYMDKITITWGSNITYTDLFLELKIAQFLRYFLSHFFSIR